MKFQPVAMLGLLLTLTACAELNSIHHMNAIKLGEARVLTVDAKQRNVFMVPGKDAEANLRICAEAAPDVFSAISASAGLDANLTERKAKLAAAVAESAATIERTQTINLLRESMYRTCERYLSGALGKSSFIVQAARDQRTMLAVLAIEQLTRAARPPAIILAASGTNASVANDEAIALITKFAKEKGDAETARMAADGAFENAKKESDCGTIKDAPAADPELKKWTTCVTARETLATRTAEAAAASERFDKLLAVTSSAGTTGASTMAGTNSDGAGGGGLSDLAITSVALAVKEITLNSGIDESLMFCIAYLTELPPVDLNGVAVVNNCNEIIMRRFNNDEAVRGKIMNLSGLGTPVTGATYQAPQPGDTALPILKAYLLDKSVSVEERKRRTTLAGEQAVKMGLISEANAIVNIVAPGDESRAAVLLAMLRIIETDAAAKAALKVQ